MFFSTLIIWLAGFLTGMYALDLYIKFNKDKKKDKNKCKHKPSTDIILFTDYQERYWKLKCNRCGETYYKGMDD